MDWYIVESTSDTVWVAEGDGSSVEDDAGSSGADADEDGCNTVESSL